MFDELFHLLSQLGLGTAARPLCDLIIRLAGESMTLHQFHQEIQTVLSRHGSTDSAEAVIALLVEAGVAGLSRAEREEKAEEAESPSPGCSRFEGSDMLADEEGGIVVVPRAGCETHETARRWLDIDSGIYFDVRQHGAGFDPER